MQITIYGADACERCATARAALPGAKYRDHGDLYDVYDADTAVAITTSTGGNLPIIVIDAPGGRLVLTMSDGGNDLAGACSGGSCKI